MEYVCLECQCAFDTPARFVETHGFSHGPYEEWGGCPECGGAYTTAHKCACCDKVIVGEYVKIGDNRYCDNCYCHYELGDED